MPRSFNYLNFFASKIQFRIFINKISIKTRTVGFENPNEPRPASSVDAKKQRGIIKAARFYAAYNPTKKRKRFDIIEVYVNQNSKRYSLAEIKHLIGTFNLNTAYAPNERTRK